MSEPAEDTRQSKMVEEIADVIRKYEPSLEETVDWSSTPEKPHVTLARLAIFETCISIALLRWFVDADKPEELKGHPFAMLNQFIGIRANACAGTVSQVVKGVEGMAATYMHHTPGKQ